MTYSPERLAYWYFRLNGFLTTEDFVVHPERGNQQRTDADILAVRFRHRLENQEIPMEDDPRVAQCDTLVNLIIAEVKTGRCALNGPWTDPTKANMQRVLRSIGCTPVEGIDDVAVALYQRGLWANSSVTIRLFAIGETLTPSLSIPKQQQLTWGEIISFCHSRFNLYRRQKSSVGIWAADGRRLQRLAQARQPNEAGMRDLFGLNTPNKGSLPDA